MRAHAEPDDLLDPTMDLLLTCGATSDSVPDSEQAGAIVAGRYKLLEAIGEGGMGTVWMAEQREPVKRLVALKMIKPGMDSRQVVLARFEAERQALALMDHPNIAQILDGGTTRDSPALRPGRPYFVMELVKGVPITEYCDRLPAEPRSGSSSSCRLPRRPARAPEGNHPSRHQADRTSWSRWHDGNPVPKVIDFGVAKAIAVGL